MQLASYGTRARYLSRFIPRNPGISLGRSIHIPAAASPAGTVEKVVNTTRNVLTRFFAHLTAPGLRAPSTSFPTTPRSLYTASRTRAQGIHANLSFPTRQTLARGPFLPRAPAVQRSVTQVGLGTARNFSSTRPIFQNLAQNVPVAGRAFWEADWQIKGLDDERVKVAMHIGKEDNTQKSGEMMKPLRDSMLTLETESDITEDSAVASELEHYFSAPAISIAQVTTYLLIPLAPTPTSRLPNVSMSSSPRGKVERLLPLPYLAAMHTSHFVHGLRVSSLFARLDQGGVWDKGVTCDAYSSGGEHEGVCTVLRVAFEGWTQAEVRSVIGESGTGWCELIERDRGESSSILDDDEISESGTSDLSSVEGRQEHEHQDVLLDPSQSVVLPTLDFSSSFLAVSPSPPLLSRTDSDRDIDFLSYDNFSDVGSNSDSESWVDTRGPSRFGFSSEFTARFEENGPREVMV